MKRPNNGPLSFWREKHLHHFVAEQDVAKELFALLVEAKQCISVMS